MANRRCCCSCYDIWNVQRWSISPPTGLTRKTNFQADPTYFNTDSSYAAVFDHYNEKNYMGFVKPNPPAPNKIRIYVYDDRSSGSAIILDTTPTLAGHPYNGCKALGLAPAVGKLSYAQVSATADTYGMMSLNYDGTGDTKLFDFPVLSNEFYSEMTTRTVYDWRRNLFYTSIWCNRTLPNRTTRRIYSFVPGQVAAPSVIYDQTINGILTNTGQIQIRLFCYDGINDKIIFYEQLGTPVSSRLVKRCDPNGANVETMMDVTNSFTVCQAEISYKDRCLYTWDTKGIQATDVFGGMFKRSLEDYSQLKKILNRNQFPTDYVGGGFHLGCGFETVGSGYRGRLM